MPDLSRSRRGAISPWIGVVVLLIAFALFWFLVFLPTQKRVNRIHTFLGTNRGPESSWTGLMGRWESNNKFHREQYTQIACSLWKLEHPAQAAAMAPGAPCPPPGPSTKPPGGPTYP
jgi:hypothetical protein